MIKEIIMCCIIFSTYDSEFLTMGGSCEYTYGNFPSRNVERYVPLDFTGDLQDAYKIVYNQSQRYKLETFYEAASKFEWKPKYYAYVYPSYCDMIKISLERQYNKELKLG